MFVLHPEHRERLLKQRDSEAAFWLALFERLDRLVKVQLLACPDSTAHWEESLSTPWRCVETIIVSPEPMILGPDSGHRDQTTC
jgi:hypothetical protein